MVRRVGPCPLCLELRSRNDEDLMPSWARLEALRLVPPKDLRFYPPRLKLRICTACNDNMARRYENGAAPLVKPMMRGAERSLSAGEQRDVSLWAIKTVLVFGIADKFKHRVDYEVWRQLLLRMTDKDVPPGGSSVRIGWWPVGEEAAIDRAATLADLLPNRPPQNLQLFMVSSLAHFVMEVVVMSDVVDALDWAARTPDSDWLIRIWPPNVVGVGYPPPRLLTADNIAGLRNAFSAAAPQGRFVRHAAGPDWYIQT